MVDLSNLVYEMQNFCDEYGEELLLGDGEEGGDPRKKEVVDSAKKILELSGYDVKKTAWSGQEGIAALLKYSGRNHKRAQRGNAEDKLYFEVIKVLDDTLFDNRWEYDDDYYIDKLRQVLCKVHDYWDTKFIAEEQKGK